MYVKLISGHFSPQRFIWHEKLLPVIIKSNVIYSCHNHSHTSCHKNLNLAGILNKTCKKLQVGSDCINIYYAKFIVQSKKGTNHLFLEKLVLYFIILAD